jgi:hypothetical protein
VAYTPDWEPIAGSLKRVMGAGLSENEAKTDLCYATADKRIDVRVRIAACVPDMHGKIFSGGNVGVPAHLNPVDLDWVQSRPLKPWSIGPKLGQHYSWITGWKERPIDLIELSVRDVTNVLCIDEGVRENAASEKQKQEAKATNALAEYLKKHPESERDLVTRDDAENWCKERGFSITRRGFQQRVWPDARHKAGLPPTASQGRKRGRARESSC